VVPSISDLAPLDLAVRFEDAAKSAGQMLTVQQYTPVPLAAKDPFGLVQGLMLIPLLIGGYMSSTLLMAATGKAAGRWRAAQLAGFAVAGGLAVDLIVCLWLQGFSSSKF
jgi:ABC-type arginine transport system permease subunit